MQVMFHLGAPCTDGDRLIRSLLRDRDALAEHNISVPAPERYRALLRDTLNRLDGHASTPDMQEALLDAIVDEDVVDRLILSDPRFICINRLVAQGAQIWPMIDRKSDALRCIWPEAETEFFIGIRNPATLVPALFQASRFKDFAEFSENIQPHALTWSEAILRLRNAQPDCRIVVWCNEDTPLLWGEILCQIAGLSGPSGLTGRDDLVEAIMDPTGFARLKTYLAETPPASERQRRMIVAAFLERYAKEDELEVTLDLPGWTEDLVAEMTALYDADIEVIGNMRNVTLLVP